MHLAHILLGGLPEHLFLLRLRAKQIHAAPQHGTTGQGHAHGEAQDKKERNRQKSRSNEGA